MSKIASISYHEMLEQFKRAEAHGSRLRMGELDTSEWLQKEKIQQSDVIEFSKKFPDPRFFIIKEGAYKGFYIYSKQEEQGIRIYTEQTTLTE
ncbi:hypothetical protein EYV94_14190 [Puteibacter caeruleilacunae]|nr:hypothetical protein EYV94_14190 [Puteibacter caeruleilacunae]